MGPADVGDLLRQRTDPRGLSAQSVRAQSEHSSDSFRASRCGSCRPIRSTQRFRPGTAARGQVRRAENVGSHETVALSVGRDSELKGLEFAIHGLSVAARLGSSELRLWILGDGNVRKYEEMAARAGVAERVRFFGNRVDIERYYQAADLFVLPTLCETFCRAAHEAAACGVPVVATRVDGVTDWSAKSGAGELVERDAASVGGALARLAADPKRRAGSATKAESAVSRAPSSARSPHSLPSTTNFSPTRRRGSSQARRRGGYAAA